MDVHGLLYTSYDLKSCSGGCCLALLHSFNIKNEVYSLILPSKTLDREVDDLSLHLSSDTEFNKLIKLVRMISASLSDNDYLLS